MSVPSQAPIPEPATSRSQGRARPRAVWRRTIPVAIAGMLAPMLLIGAPYFLLPIGERVRHPLHDWFKPSGYVGQSAGVLTLLLFLFMYLYPLRKRLRRLAGRGSLARWLEVHIVAGLAIPVVGAIHAGWRFQGLIGLGYLAMLMVSLSGIAGRYLYTRMPRGESGNELTAVELSEKQMDLVLRIADRTGLDPAEVHTALARAVPRSVAPGSLRALAALLRGEFSRRKRMRGLRREWETRFSLDRAGLDEIIRLARQRMALQQQQAVLESTRRLFGYWHVVHRPFSVTAFVAVTVHVVAVVALGVTWFW